MGEPMPEARSVLRMQAHTTGVCPICSRAMGEPDNKPGAPIRGWMEIHEVATSRSIRAREDQATEAEIKRVGRRLAEWCGDGADYEMNAGGARKDFDGEARELMALLFGEEASRV